MYGSGSRVGVAPDQPGASASPGGWRGHGAMTVEELKRETARRLVKEEGGNAVDGGAGGDGRTASSDRRRPAGPDRRDHHRGGGGGGRGGGGRGGPHGSRTPRRGGGGGRGRSSGGVVPAGPGSDSAAQAAAYAGSAVPPQAGWGHHQPGYRPQGHPQGQPPPPSPQQTSALAMRRGMSRREFARLVRRRADGGSGRPADRAQQHHPQQAGRPQHPGHPQAGPIGALRPHPPGLRLQPEGGGREEGAPPGRSGGRSPPGRAEEGGRAGGQRLRRNSRSTGSLVAMDAPNNAGYRDAGTPTRAMHNVGPEAFATPARASRPRLHTTGGLGSVHVPPGGAATPRPSNSRAGPTGRPAAAAAPRTDPRGLAGRGWRAAPPGQQQGQQQQRQAPVQRTSKLAHGLTVQELKSMTRARLAAENLDRASPGAPDHGSVRSAGSSSPKHPADVRRPGHPASPRPHRPHRRPGDLALFSPVSSGPSAAQGWSDPWETSSAAAGPLASPSGDSGPAFAGRGRCHSAEAGVPAAPAPGVLSPPGMPRLSSRLDGGGYSDVGLGRGGDLGVGPAFFAGDEVTCPSMPPLSSPSRASRPRLHTTGGMGGYGRPSGLPTIESFAEPSPDRPHHRGPLTSGDRMLSSDSNDLPSSMAEAVLASITSRGGGTGDRDDGGNDGPPPCPSPSPFLGGPGMFSLSLDFLGGPGGPCPPPPGLVPSSGSSEPCSDELAPRALRLGSSESTFSLPSPPSNGNTPLPGGSGSMSWGTEDRALPRAAGTPGRDAADGLAHDLGDLLRVYPGPPLRGRAATEPATSSTGADGLLGFGPAGGGGYPGEYTQF